jgi:rare lipoprotein A
MERKSAPFENKVTFLPLCRFSTASYNICPKIAFFWIFSALQHRFALPRKGWFWQAVKPNNRLRMIDLSCSRKDNNRWSVQMKRTSFWTASRGIQRTVWRLGTGILMMGVALSASAKDGSPSGTAPPATAHPPLKAKSKHWLQVGVASWYGAKFQGRKTAGGERFDMNRMTCAHRSLPLGTWLRVTNLTNHKTAFVRVNDRGPVLQGRIVDLSFAAARALGLAGVGKVRLEPVSDGDPDLATAQVSQLQMPAALIPATH